jgi:hypothetical protein
VVDPAAVARRARDENDHLIDDVGEVRGGDHDARSSTSLLAADGRIEFTPDDSASGEV